MDVFSWNWRVEVESLSTIGDKNRIFNTWKFIRCQQSDVAYWHGPVIVVITFSSDAKGVEDLNKKSPLPATKVRVEKLNWGILTKKDI